MVGGKQIMSKVLKRGKSKSSNAVAAAAAAESTSGSFIPTPRMDFETDQSGRQAGDAQSSGGDGNKHCFMAKHVEFEVDKRYEFIRYLGGGAYGTVVSCNDTKTGKKVAVKKVNRLFGDLTDAKRILREVRLLRTMQHPNVLPIHDIDEPVDYTSFDDLYIVTQLMDSDLTRVLKHKTKLQDTQRCYLAYQILKAMKYIHSGNILHRDLKPANIIVDENCDLRVCDFGLARYIEADAVGRPLLNDKMTTYVVTRWYRAPELMLDCGNYTGAVDMWAVGCIAAEMFVGRAIFTGNNVMNQLDLVCEGLGRPKDLSWIPNHRARQYIAAKPERPTKPLKDRLKGIDAAAYDFIYKLLVFNPKDRLTAVQALEHPWMQKYRDKATETVADMARLQDYDLEPPSERDLGARGVRHLIWNEIKQFRPHIVNKEPKAAKIAEEIIAEVSNFKK